MTLKEIETLIRDLAMHVDPEPLRRYEALAEAFRMDTGEMAPGKDDPERAMSEHQSMALQKRWQDWLKERNRHLHRLCMELVEDPTLTQRQRGEVSR